MGGMGMINHFFENFDAITDYYNFLIAKTKISNRHNISPIEVKSSKNYTLSSLRKFTTKYAEQTYTPYVLHTQDYKEADGIFYLPLYMTPLI